MTASFNYRLRDSLPKVPVKLYEYALTRKDTIGPDGGLIKDAVTYASPISKGSYVVLYSDSNSGGEIVVAPFVAGNEYDQVAGVIVDDPIGEDNVTATAGTPAHAYRRRATMAAFCIAVDSFVADGTQTAGYYVGAKESGDTTLTLTTRSATPTANGQPVAMAYQTTGLKFPVCIGYMGSMPVD